MTVKTTVSFTDRHHEYAHAKVKEGVFASVSSLVAAGIEQVMREDAERDAMLEGMKNTIKKRMETPAHEWVEMNSDDKLFEVVRSRIARYKD